MSQSGSIGPSAGSIPTPVPVNLGGTGDTFLPPNTGLFGNGTDPVLPASSPLNNGQIYIGNTGTTPSAGYISSGTNINVTNSPGGITISATGAGYLPPDNANIYWVRANGSNANNGLNIEQAVQTFNYAISLAAAQSPGPTNPFVVVCLDAAIYLEDITLTTYIDIFAPNIQLGDGTTGGSLIIDGFCNATIGYQHVRPGQIAMVKTNSPGDSGYFGKHLYLLGNANGIQCFSETLSVSIEQVSITDGTLFIDSNDINETTTIITINSVSITGNGTVFNCQFINSFWNGSIGYIENKGTGVADAFVMTGGTCNLTINQISVNNAINIDGSTTVLNLNAFIMTGTRNVSGGALFNLWLSPVGQIGSTGMLDGQIVVGNSSGAPQVAYLTPGANVSIVNAPGSITISSTGVSAPNEANIIWVRSNGIDSNSGLNIAQAVKTFTRAIALCMLQTPGPNNFFTVVCLDAGLYPENITLPAYIDIFAPNCQIGDDVTGGSIVIDGLCNVTIGYQHVLPGQIGLVKTNTIGDSGYYIKHLYLYGSANGTQCFAGNLNFNAEQISVQDGTIFIDSTNLRTTTTSITNGSIEMNGNGTVFNCQFKNSSWDGRISYVTNVGSGTTNGIVMTGGNCNVTINALQCTNAINIAGALTVLNLNCSFMVGTRSVTSGALFNLWLSPQAPPNSAGMANGQLIIGNNNNPPSVANLTAGTNISITNAPGSITIASTPDANTVPNGRTGDTSFTAHGVVLGEGTSALGVTTAGLAGQPLLSGGATADPNWGTLGVGYGGTGKTALANFGLLTGNGSSPINSLSTGASGQPLLSGGALANPEFGTLSTAYGGTGFTGSYLNGQILIGNNSGTLTSSTLTAGSNISITNASGSITIASTPDANTVPNGRTGDTSFTAHGVLLGEGTSPIGNTSAGTSGQPLLSGGAASDPGWGTLSVGYGGTGDTSFTAHGVVLGEGTSALGVTSAGTAGQPLLSGGASSDPTWGTLSTTVGGTGLTGSYADGQILIGNSSGTLTANTLTAGSNITITNASGAVTIAASGGSTLYGITNNTSPFNTALGYQALVGATGNTNVAVGGGSLIGSSGNYNVSVGYGSQIASTGTYNVTLGNDCMVMNTRSASGCVGIGQRSLNAMGSGSTFGAVYNTAVGYNSLGSLAGGTTNSSFGYSAGSAYSGIESNNINIGANCTGVLGESGVTRIGVQGTQTETYIAGLYGSTIPVGNYPVYVTSTGHVGVGSPTIRAINVVTFTSSGSYTPTAGMLYIVVEVVGGGGGGAGTFVGASQPVMVGGSGGGGGYARVILSATQVSASTAITIGAGGAGGDSGLPGPNDGDPGGNTSFGLQCVAYGGLQGLAGIKNTAGAIAAGARGGYGLTGTVLISGASAQSGMIIASGPLGTSGTAGGSFLGGGSYGPTLTATNNSYTGVGTSSYGGGGSGSIAASSASAGGAVGGTGGNGVCFITEFLA